MTALIWLVTLVTATAAILVVARLALKRALPAGLPLAASAVVALALLWRHASAPGLEVAVLAVAAAAATLAGSALWTTLETRLLSGPASELQTRAATQTRLAAVLAVLAAAAAAAVGPLTAGTYLTPMLGRALAAGLVGIAAVQETPVAPALRALLLVALLA